MTSTTATWIVEMRFEEREDHTQAKAVLLTPAGRELHGHGLSKRNPMDRPLARIGEEVAGARALSNLAHELLEFAAAEIERNVHGVRAR
jgi:Domain of unknown function (DUF1876)